MKPILSFTDEIREQVQEFEHKCELLCSEVESKYRLSYEQKGVKLIVELVRSKNQTSTSAKELFQKGYHSFVEIGFEKEGEFYSTSTFSIWKCKEEWFKKVGYFTDCPLSYIETFIEHVLKEMIHDLE